MKERAAHFCKAQITVQLVLKTDFFLNRKEVPAKEKEPGREPGPTVASMVLLAGTFRNTLLPVLVSLKSLNTQVRIHLTDYKGHFSIPECYVRAALYISIFIHRTYGRNGAKLPRGECCLAVRAATFSLQRKSGCLPVSSSHQIILLLQYHEAIFILCTSRCSKC